VLYLANASSPAVRAAMTAGELGQMCTPNERRAPLPGVIWAADNGCFNAARYVGDDRWLAWLRSHAGAANRCLFATAPDVVGDAVATLTRSAPFLPVIREMGYQAALVAQDGLEHLTVPWDEFDVLFIGGSTEWKLGPAAAQLAIEAKRRGKRVHMGRVNSLRRLRIAAAIDSDTADGTFIAIAPDTNLPRFRVWMRGLHADQRRRTATHVAPDAPNVTALPQVGGVLTVKQPRSESGVSPSTPGT